VRISIDEQIISEVDLSGRGGKEEEISLLLGTKWQREDASLFDYRHVKFPNERIEAKKQQNTQWFDIGKYNDLDEETKRIWMLFICYRKGKPVDLIYQQRLGDFLNTVCQDTDCRSYGWTEENIESCYEQKLKYPSMQAKVKLVSRKYHKTHSVREEARIVTIYDKGNDK